MATTTTGSELIANVLANPKDANALLVLADWLGEQGWTEDEDRCRTEAKGLLNGQGPKTLSDYKGQSVRNNDANDWNRRTQWLLALALKAQAPDRVKLKKKEATWTGTGEYLIWLDDTTVDLEVGAKGDGSWYGYLNGKATCTVSVSYEKKKVFPYGKAGFSTHKIVAEVFAQLEEANRKAVNRQASDERYDRLGKAKEELEKDFGHSYEDHWEVNRAKYGERLSLTIERSPEEIRAILKVLQEAGLLKGKEKE